MKFKRRSFPLEGLEIWIFSDKLLWFKNVHKRLPCRIKILLAFDTYIRIGSSENQQITILGENNKNAKFKLSKQLIIFYYSTKFSQSNLRFSLAIRLALIIGLSFVVRLCLFCSFSLIVGLSLVVRLSFAIRFAVVVRFSFAIRFSFVVRLSFSVRFSLVVRFALSIRFTFNFQ